LEINIYKYILEAASQILKRKGLREQEARWQVRSNLHVTLSEKLQGHKGRTAFPKDKVRETLRTTREVTANLNGMGNRKGNAEKGAEDDTGLQARGGKQDHAGTREATELCNQPGTKYTPAVLAS
jgi:hypothetical protein